MENAGFLFAAYAIVWLGFFLYLFSLLGRQRKLRRDIDTLGGTMKDKQED
jgi:CcmD family protein